MGLLDNKHITKLVDFFKSNSSKNKISKDRIISLIQYQCEELSTIYKILTSIEPKNMDEFEKIYNDIKFDSKNRDDVSFIIPYLKKKYSFKIQSYEKKHLFFAQAKIAETILKNANKAYEIFDILNPINRTRTDLEVNSYKVEPYVMAADVYTNPKYLGRGGWTWYTGAASWMYRFGIEYLLGLKKIENKIVMEPLMKDGWEEFEIEYKYKNTVYKIKVANNIKIGTSRMIEDGVLKESNSFELVDDGGIHFIELMKNE